MTILEIINKLISINEHRNTDSLYISDLSVNLCIVEASGDTITTGFSNVASWRGVYAEPCLIGGPEHDLKMLVGMLYTLASGMSFNGWKGGRYSYSLNDELNFEHCESSYSGDGYFEDVKYNPDTDTIDLYLTKSN